MLSVLSLATIGLAFFVIAVSPGPANLSNATLAMSRGRKVSLIYGFGLSSGLVFWGIVAATGVGAVLQSSVYLLVILKVFGGLYLLRLAFLSGKEALKAKAEPLEVLNNSISNRSWFIRGFILNVSNPKTVIAWMAALSVGLDSSAGLVSVISGVLVCVMVGFVTNALYSICFSFSGVMKIYQKISRWINGVASVLFSLAGLGLIRSAFHRSPG